MKYLIAMILYSCILLGVNCGSKKAADKNEVIKTDVPVFGIYLFESKGKVSKSVGKAKATVELKNDSTAVLKMTTTITGGVQNEGHFAFRNDSIFINWNNGSVIKSKFERKDGYYSFRIGSTPYKKEL
jgi:hypothetical protein